MGTDTDRALEKLSGVSISLHCWQGDDVLGFEDPDRGLSGGIMATGNYPGKARTPYELRADLNIAYSLIPGSHHLNLHAMYLDTDVKVPRGQIEPKHFAPWVDWAKEHSHGLDFFDAGINRIAAWVIGTRNTLKVLLMALLEPIDTLRQIESAGDYTSRLALPEELKTLPFGTVWDVYCARQEVPVGMAFLDEIKRYEKAVLSHR